MNFWQTIMCARIWTTSLFIWLALSSAGHTVSCEDLSYNGTSYTACTVDMASDDLRLFHRDTDGNVLGDFANVEAATGEKLIFAMNAGMYHADRSAVGLYIEDGEVRSPIVIREGPGNFGLLPNGVFCIGPDNTAAVYESLRFASEQPICRFASQSGPMLVIDGALHPRFLPDGTSKNIRNGVGVTKDGRFAVFVISNELVNFHDFGAIYKDHLRIDQALYFDGTISRLYAPEHGRSDYGFRLGPIVGVIDDGDNTE